MGFSPTQNAMITALVGTLERGTRRAWVSIPIGEGKYDAVAEAIRRVTNYGGSKRVLYVTGKPLMQHIAVVCTPSRLLYTKCAEADEFNGVTVVSHASLRAGFDTWVQYGGFDLIIIDQVPYDLWSATKLGAAVRGVLTQPAKVWLIGASA